MIPANAFDNVVSIVFVVEDGSLVIDKENGRKLVFRDDDLEEPCLGKPTGD